MGKMLDLFKEIWEEREHKSYISDVGLFFNPWCFAHVLSKQSYPRYKFNKDNIVLLTPEEHFKLDHETHKAKEDPKFDKLFEYADKLKQEYNQGL